MSIIAPSDFIALADNIAKTLVDLEAGYITNPGITTPTTATVSNGQNGSTHSLQSRVAALNDIGQEAALAPVTLQTIQAVTAYLTSTQASKFYSLYNDWMYSVEGHVGGLNAYLTSNGLLVHPEFANAFNAMVAVQASVGVTVASIVPGNVFLPTQQTIATFAVTGATTGTFAVGTPVDTSKYSAPFLAIKNTRGVTSSGSATAFTIYYHDQNDTSQSFTYTLSGSLAAGATASIGIRGYSITNILITSGVAPDTFAVVTIVPRTISY